MDTRFEGEAGDVLPEICRFCHVREGDECQCDLGDALTFTFPASLARTIAACIEVGAEGNDNIPDADYKKLQDIAKRMDDAGKNRGAEVRY